MRPSILYPLKCQARENVVVEITKEFVDLLGLELIKLNLSGNQIERRILDQMAI